MNMLQRGESLIIVFLGGFVKLSYSWWKSGEHVFLIGFGKYNFGIIYHDLHVGKIKNSEACQIYKCSLFPCREISLPEICFGQAEPQEIHIQTEQGRVQACLGHSSFCRVCQLNKNKNYHTFKTLLLKTPSF